MKKLIALLILLFAVNSHAYKLQNTWQEVDQAVDDVQAAQPLPEGRLIPGGGTTGQVLIKNSDTDYDTKWSIPPGGKWYEQKAVSSPAADTVYEWMRPFEPWRFTNIVGKVNTGEAVVDIQLCDVDLTNCASFLSSPVTLTTTEQTLSLVYDGINANQRVVLATVGTPTATNILMDASGLYETGTPPVAPTGDLFYMDFETDPGLELVSGTIVCPATKDGDVCPQDNTKPYAGVYSLHTYGTDTTATAKKRFSGVDDVTFDWWWNFDVPQSSGTPVRFYDNADAQIGYMYVYLPTNRIDFSFGTVTRTTTTFVVTEGTWYHIRVRVKRESTSGAGDGVIQYWYSDTITDFDGVTPTEEWLNVAVDSAVIDSINMGAFAGGTVFYDNFRGFNTTTGN